MAGPTRQRNSTGTRTASNASSFIHSRRTSRVAIHSSNQQRPAHRNLQAPELSIITTLPATSTQSSHRESVHGYHGKDMLAQLQQLRKENQDLQAQLSVRGKEFEVLAHSFGSLKETFARSESRNEFLQRLTENLQHELTHAQEKNRMQPTPSHKLASLPGDPNMSSASPERPKCPPLPSPNVTPSKIRKPMSRVNSFLKHVSQGLRREIHGCQKELGASSEMLLILEGQRSSADDQARTSFLDNEIADYREKLQMGETKMVNLQGQFNRLENMAREVQEIQQSYSEQCKKVEDYSAQESELQDLHSAVEEARDQLAEQQEATAQADRMCAQLQQSMHQQAVQFDAVRQVLEKTISATEEDAAAAASDAAAATAVEVEEQISLRRGLVAARQELVAVNTRLDELAQDHEQLRHIITQLEERNLSLLSQLEAANAEMALQRGPSPASGASRRPSREPRGSYLLTHTHTPRTNTLDRQVGFGTSNGRTCSSSLNGEVSSVADALDGMMLLYCKAGRRKTFSSFSISDGDKWNSSPVSPRAHSPIMKGEVDDAAANITASVDVFRQHFCQTDNTVDTNPAM